MTGLAINRTTPSQELQSNATFDVLEWVKRSRRPTACGRRNGLRLVDLFCGCGGMTLGVSEAARLANRRTTIALAVDAAPGPLSVYRDNFDPICQVALETSVLSLFSSRLNGNFSAGEHALRQRVRQVHAIVAGPPCQGHSDLNNHSRREDARNALYLAAARAALVLEPEVLVIENVPGVVHDRGRVVHRALEALVRSGAYNVTEGVVPLLSVGIPQARRRHLLVASRSGLFDLSCLRQAQPPASVGEFLAGIEDEPKQFPGAFFQPARMTPRNQERTSFLFANDLHDLPDAERPACHRDRPHSYRSVYGRLWWDRPSQTITSGFGSMGQGRYVHPTRPRLITPHEAARIQGFPDYFSFEKASGVTALREMIGNAVPPPLMIRLFSRLMAQGLL